MQIPTNYNLDVLLPDTSAARAVTLLRCQMLDSGFKPVPLYNAVIGDRRWKLGLPTSPEPFTEMPIDWAHAFGAYLLPSMLVAGVALYEAAREPIAAEPR